MSERPFVADAAGAGGGTVRLEVTNLGGERRVVVEGPHWRMARLADRSDIRTLRSMEFLRALIDAKGAWALDELDRVEEPAYVRRPLEALLRRFRVDLPGKDVLDLGSGGGASAIHAIALGARSVVGLEPAERLASLAALRARDHGLQSRADFRLTREGDKLPFEGCRFDLVLCESVLEHVLPPLRRSFLREAWRTLRPGGHLLLLQTPNRLWPKDDHTTGLWVLPWLPLRWKLALARRWSRDPAAARASDDALLRDGVHGVTWWEVERHLAGLARRCLNLADGRDVRHFFRVSLERPQPESLRRAKRALRAVLLLAETAFARPMGWPGTILLPNLDLCFQKPRRGPDRHRLGR